MNQRAKARVLASLIPVVFLAIGFKAADVSSVTILPGSAAGQIHITIHGYLRELLDCPPQDRRVWGAVVAREGVACSPQLDPIFLLQRVA